MKEEWEKPFPKMGSSPLSRAPAHLYFPPLNRGADAASESREKSQTAKGRRPVRPPKSNSQADNREADFLCRLFGQFGQEWREKRAASMLLLRLLLPRA